MLEEKPKLKLIWDIAGSIRFAKYEPANDKIGMFAT
jgi:hypothetical protein